MRTRNTRAALQDKTPINTPQSERRATPKDLLSSAKKPLPALSIHGRRLGTQNVLPVNFLTSTDLLVSPTPRNVPLESTPTTRRHHRARLPRKSLNPVRVPFSPLPPSSPPSSDEEGPAPILIPTSHESEEHVHEDDGVDENKENDVHVIQDRTDITIEENVDEDASGDDPFGFLEVERQLKVRREVQHRSSVAPISERETATGSRAPFNELFHRPSPAPSTSRRRPPTPYHPSDDLRQSDGLRPDGGLPPSDDLEDMYLDVSKDNGNYSSGKIQLLQEMQVEEDEEEALQEEEAIPPVAPSTPEVLRTPRPHHVKNIEPLPSPFSSTQGTPHDGTHTPSMPSSPSPVKPMTALRPLLSTVKKGTWAETMKDVPLSWPGAKTKSPATVVSKSPATVVSKPPATVKAKPPATVTKKKVTKVSKATVAPMPNLLDLMPKRPIKRATKATAAPSTSASAAAKSRKAATTSEGKGKQKVENVESQSESEGEESVVDSPLATRKRKAVAKGRGPAKRARVEVLVPAPPRRRKANPEASASASTGTSMKTRAKGKGKAVAKLPDEDSVCVQERIAVDVHMLISVQVGRGASPPSED